MILAFGAVWLLSFVAVATLVVSRPIATRTRPVTTVAVPYRRPSRHIGRVPSTVAGLLFVIVLIGACGIPFPGGEGSSSPEERERPPPLEDSRSAEDVGRAIVEAWGRGDRERVDALSETEAEDALLKRPFPSPAPELVNCRESTRGAGEMTCLFTTDGRTFELRTLRGDEDRWRVRSVKFHAW